MGNILDYLDWRGDIPFSCDPFNDVDNLVLAQSAYMRLDGMIGKDEVITPKEATRRFFARHDHEEIMENDSLHKRAPFIMEKLSCSRRFSKMQIAHYVNEIDTDADAQMCAMTFILPDFIYIAFRGTDDSLAGWKEDFNLSYMRETKGQRRALEYVNERLGEYSADFYIGGHSKGGNFSVYSASFCDRQFRDRIIKVFSNDGPGFRKEIVASKEYNETLQKVTSILPESTLVGMLFSGRYEHKIVKSTNTGLMQHFAVSWEVLGNSFVEASDFSEEGRRMDEAVGTWLDGLSDEDRRKFSDATFEILQASGATSSEDIRGGAAGVLDLLRKSRVIPKERRKEFNGMLLKLLRLGGTSLFANG